MDLTRFWNCFYIRNSFYKSIYLIYHFPKPRLNYHIRQGLLRKYSRDSDLPRGGLRLIEEEHEDSLTNKPWRRGMGSRDPSDLDLAARNKLQGRTRYEPPDRDRMAQIL
jgi:hypothetical protein